MSRPNFNDDYGGKYILIEPGTFVIGDQVGDGLPREYPTMEVGILNPFFIGERLVTQAHWTSIMGNNPAKFSEGWSAGLRPVESVSYYDCLEFIEAINETDANNMHLGLRGKWRLPSEAEWEYCAKAGTNTKWHFGNSDSDLDDYGWHAGNAGASTREVGSKKPNPWGLYDIHGCVSEWCLDNYHNEYKPQPTQEPFFDTSDVFIHRGGSWFTESDSTRSSARSYSVGTKKSDGIGIRLVWEPLQ